MHLAKLLLVAALWTAESAGADQLLAPPPPSPTALPTPPPPAPPAPTPPIRLVPGPGIELPTLPGQPVIRPSLPPLGPPGGGVIVKFPFRQSPK